MDKNANTKAQKLIMNKCKTNKLKDNRMAKMQNMMKKAKKVNKKWIMIPVLAQIMIKLSMKINEIKINNNTFQKKQALFHKKVKYIQASQDKRKAKVN